MTNEAISAIFEHLCNEARNFAHATYGTFELLREHTPDPQPNGTWAKEGSIGDRMLCFIDDAKALVSVETPSLRRGEQFDLVLCAAGIVDALNLVSKRRARQFLLTAGEDFLMLRQDREAAEEVLTRVLNTAFQMTRTSQIQIRLSASREGNGVRSIVAARDADLARKLILWLNADPDQMVLQDPSDVPFIVAMLVAGKRLRAMGGTAELERDAVGHLSVALNIPSLEKPEPEHAPAIPQSDEQSDPLSVLVAEDCDESFVLSEVVLQNECVSRARDGHEALSKIHKQRFDLVLMDIHMPGPTGYEVIRNIREWETETGNARTPIVVLSSDDLETQRRSAAQSGCSGFLRKPLQSSELNRLLARIRDARVLVG